MAKEDTADWVFSKMVTVNICRKKVKAFIIFLIKKENTKTIGSS